MRNNDIALIGLTGLAVALLSGFGAEAQDIFTTEDFRQDRTLWTSPGYYGNNTMDEIIEMQVENRFGETGEGVEGALDLTSPYPYTSATEHYEALLQQAGGGTKHSYDTLPDWRGRWVGGALGLDGGDNPASAVAAMLTPEYQEYFVQEMKAVAEGRMWDADAFCLPGGYIESVVNAEEFIVTPEKVWTIGADNTANYIRWIYTDGSGHSAPEYEYPKWHGESVGFWDGNTLVVHTNQIRRWKGGPIEFTDNLETVERYWREGETLRGEIVLYDPEVFVRPFYSALSYERDSETRPELRPLFNSCTDTNGPSTKVFLDDRGLLNERLPGDPLYWDATDPTPWRTFFNTSDARVENSQ